MSRAMAKRSRGKQKFTTAEAAKAAGIVRGTLLNWIRRGLVRPPKPTLFRGHFTRLWTRAQVYEFRALKQRLEGERRTKIRAFWTIAEHREEQSREGVRRYTDPAERARTSAAVKKALDDDPTIVLNRTKKIRRTSRTKKSRLRRSAGLKRGWQKDPERKRRQSEKFTANWQDPEWAGQRSAAIVAGFTSEIRAQISRKGTRRYTDPAERARTGVAVALALKDPAKKAAHDAGRIRAAETLLGRTKATRPRGRPPTMAEFYKRMAALHRPRTNGPRKLAERYDPQFHENPNAAEERMRKGIEPYREPKQPNR
jgi:hypothetical protein